MLLHEFRHVDAYHRFFGIEHKFGQGFAKFGFTDTGRAEKQKGTVGPIRVGQACAGTANCVTDCFQGFGLADYPFAKFFFHAQ